MDDLHAVFLLAPIFLFDCEVFIMNEVDRITVLWPVGPCGYGNQVAVLASEFDRVLAQLNQREEELHSLEQRRRAEFDSGQVAERRVAEFPAGASIEAAAKVLSACMDYPWEYMPENGRALMRKHAKTVIEAALNPTAETTSHDE